MYYSCFEGGVFVDISCNECYLIGESGVQKR